MPDLGPLVSALEPILGPAIKAFLKTTFGMWFTGILVSAYSFYYAGEGSWLRGLLAFGLVLVLFGVVGAMLGAKRAVMGALAMGLKKNQIGGKAAGAVFDKITGVMNYADAQGERGRDTAKTAEKIPLARAESVLRKAVEDTLKATPEGGGLGGWFRRKIQGNILEKVEALTLARFRSAGADVGGVDLALVRKELCDSADGLLLEKIEGAAARVTLMFVMGALLASLLINVAIRRLPF